MAILSAYAAVHRVWQILRGGTSVSNGQIFDAVERLVHAQKTGNDALSINVTAFARGIHVLKVERGGQYLTRKFIVE